MIACKEVAGGCSLRQPPGAWTSAPSTRSHATSPSARSPCRALAPWQPLFFWSLQFDSELAQRVGCKEMPAVAFHGGKEVEANCTVAMVYGITWGIQVQKSDGAPDAKGSPPSAKNLPSSGLQIRASAARSPDYQGYNNDCYWLLLLLKLRKILYY